MASKPPTTHKKSQRTSARLTLLLLDWQVRERFFALDWLARQTAPREQFEVLWVELYDRVADQALEKADGVYSMNQKGLYHKHKGYNLGLLEANGDLFCVCDSDAVFPPDFVESVLRSFEQPSGQTRPQVLMHYEYRTRSLYPEDGLDRVGDLADFQWQKLWPNVGACMTIRREDAIRFGGFDEDKRYRGYMCGPYDLGWRLINAGLPEFWHDPQVALYHFAHPDPTGTTHTFSFRLWREIAHPHFDGHAAPAVEAFCSGKLLPHVENPEIRSLRLSDRWIGSEMEREIARRLGPEGMRWTARAALRMRCMRQTSQRAGGGLIRGLLRRILGRRGYQAVKKYLGRGALRRLVRTCMGDRRYEKLKRMCGRGGGPVQERADSAKDGTS